LIRRAFDGEAPVSTFFDDETALERQGASTYHGRMTRAFWIINGPNGGYVAAILLRALIETVADSARAPRSLTVHYLRPPREGPVVIETCLERAGRTVSTASARLLQEGRLVAIALGAFATDRAGYELTDCAAPTYPPPETCERIAARIAGVEMHDRYDSRVAVGAPFSGDRNAVIGGWIRLAEPRLVDALLVAAYTDAFTPAVFAAVSGRGNLGPVPTLDLTVHFRTTLPLEDAEPDDYCALTFRSRLARSGFVEEDGEVWSASGVLLAQSRQLAIVG
jgi:acyl-CoA thioesterase